MKTTLKKLVATYWIPFGLIPAGCVLAAIFFAIIVTPKYSSTALILVQAGEAETFDAVQQRIAGYTELVRTEDVVNTVIDTQFEPGEIDAGQGRLLDTIGSIRSGLGLAEPRTLSSDESRTIEQRNVLRDLSVAGLADSTIVEVSYEANTPQRAAEIANAFANNLVQVATEQYEYSAEAYNALVSEIADELRDRIRFSYEQAQQLRASSDDGVLLDLELQISRLSDSLSEIRQQTSALSQRISLLSDLDSLAGLEKASSQVEGASRVYQAYSQSFESLSNLVAEAEPDNRAISQIRQRLDQLDEELKRILIQGRTALEQERSVLIAERASVEEDLASALALINSEAWTQIQSAESEALVFSEIYGEYVRELTDSQRQAAAVPISLLSPAKPDPTPVSPRYRMMLMLSVVMGLLLGSLYMSLEDFFSSSKAARARDDELKDGDNTNTTPLKKFNRATTKQQQSKAN
ncbi:MAG: hypothetical protein AAGA06_11705 [Pseudomonadota bacterium]